MMAGTMIRAAHAGDEAGIAAVHWAARRIAYRGLLPDEDLDGRTATSLTQEWIEILARQDGSLTHLAEDAERRTLGFVTGGQVRERSRPVTGDLSDISAEVSMLYVLPERMRHGLGRALFGASVQRLVALGHRGLVVWGYRGNPYLRFYARLGGLLAAESKRELAGRLFPTEAYVWHDLDRLIVACRARR